MGRAGRQEHAAVEGVPAAPRAGREGPGRRHRRRVHAGGRRRVVDAHRATELAAQAADARGADDAAAALERAREGLGLFRGEVLVDAGDWATAHRARLEEVRLGLVEDAMAARVELGAGGELVAELEALVEKHPLREGLWASLITALYRAGTAGRCVGGVRAGAAAAGRRAGHRARRRPASARGAGAAAEPVARGRSGLSWRGSAGQPAGGERPAGRPRRGPGRRLPPPWRAAGW